MPDICTLKSWADLGEGIFGLTAAFFWFWSVAAYWYFFSTPQVGDVNRNNRLSSRYNAAAAFCAGITALLQVFVHYAPVCRSFG